MATVYLGVREGVGSLVQPAAVKVIHAHLTSERLVAELFLEEARVMSFIAHPNVCSVLEFGRANGAHYLALEFILGESWLDVLRRMHLEERRVRLEPAWVAYVLAEACRGAHAAHRVIDLHGQRPVHRYLTPKNLHMGYDGSVRVRTSCIATALASSGATHNQSPRRPLEYMAPEQIRGEVAGHAANIWSLGVMLRESLVGTRLFRGPSDADVVRAVMSGSLPSWPAHVPEALRSIADRALQPHPADRYQTALEMADELTACRTALGAASGPAELDSLLRRLFAQRLVDKQRLLREAAEESRSFAAFSAYADESEQVEEKTRFDEEKSQLYVDLLNVTGASESEPSTAIRARASEPPATRVERRAPGRAEIAPPSLPSTKQPQTRTLRTLLSSAQRRQVLGPSEPWYARTRNLVLLALVALGLAWLLTRAAISARQGADPPTEMASPAVP